MWKSRAINSSDQVRITLVMSLIQISVLSLLYAWLSFQINYSPRWESVEMCWIEQNVECCFLTRAFLLETHWQEYNWVDSWKMFPSSWTAIAQWIIWSSSTMKEWVSTLGNEWALMYYYSLVLLSGSLYIFFVDFEVTTFIRVCLEFLFSSFRHITW